MKSISLSFLLAVLAFLAASCQKNEANVDLRDQYVGTYAVVGSQSLTSITLKSNTGTLTVSTVKNINVIISKDADDKQLKISVPGYPDLAAVMESNTFTIPPQSTQDKTATGFTYYKYYQGNGSFINNKVALNIGFGASTDLVILRSDMNLSGSKQ